MIPSGNLEPVSSAKRKPLAAATQVPAERILLETDSPYLAPQPVRGRRNEPAYVVHTLAALAQARGEDMDALGAQVDRNASACFRL